MKTGIFTPFSVSPMHPRTEMYLRFFTELGIETEVVSPAGLKRNRVRKLLAKLLINMFDCQSIAELKPKIQSFDYILIQDLKLLPLAVNSRLKGKKVIYETLDNSVYIRVHNQRRSFFYPVIRALTPVFSSLERIISGFFVHRIIVNSLVLKQRFKEKAELIYYASPFEQNTVPNKAGNAPAFLYLGAVSPEKGIDEIIELTRKYNIPCYVFGNCVNASVLERMQNEPRIIWKDRLSSPDLMAELNLILQQRFLIGISIIRPVNFSYATQEANKEIDYLAMGIPFIGNYRNTTKEKIEAGCGVFINDLSNIERLMNDVAFRQFTITRCLELYNRDYSYQNFRNKLAPLFQS